MNENQKSNWKPTRPQWSLSVRNDATGKWDKLAGGWDTERGNISLKMDRDVSPEMFLAAVRRAKGKLMLFRQDEDTDTPPRRQPVEREPFDDYMQQRRRMRHQSEPRLTAKPLQDFKPDTAPPVTSAPAPDLVPEMPLENPDADDVDWTA